ncbi:MAG: DUF3786 domain-containing protein [Clostridia bacterium]|nr:DUF3786 domain-containing protein [Clostridia bacterium]
MTGNPQYEAFLAAAVERLTTLDPTGVAERAGIEYLPDADAWRFESFGSKLVVRRKDYRVEPPLDMWHHLSILQYLSGADGRKPGERWLGLGKLPNGGLIRGASFDREIDALLARELTTQDTEALRAAAAGLGGTRVEGESADLCADFKFMPLYPLRLSLWLADDEFPASGRVRVNEAVVNCLGVEAVGTVGLLLARMLCDRVGEQQR